jgi:integrase
MAIHKLRPRQVETVKKDGMYADGGGLYLQVKRGGKSWIFRYMVDGRERSMGLGPLHTISLAEARDRALKCRQQRLDGIDPIEARNRANLDRQMAQAKEISFRQCAAGWMAIQEIGWRPRTLADVRRRFDKYIFPKIGDLPVQRLDAESPDAVQLLHDVLTQVSTGRHGGRWGKPPNPKPLWTGYHPTAIDVHEQIEGTLNWAHAQRYISNPNAASLKGPLGLLLPKGKTFHQVEHFAELPFKEAGRLMADLRACGGRWDDNPSRRSHSARLLEFLLLTAVRKEQGIKAKWKDIDLEDGIWVCSHHKTAKKTGQDYVVPLSRQAIAVIERMRDLHRELGIKIEDDGYIFPGGYGGWGKGSMSHNALNQFMKLSLKREKITIHGFRTAFGNWSVEFGHDERDSEMALGHVVGNNVRNIYKRNAKRIEPRRQMLQAWADYLDQVEPMPATVTSLGQFKAAKKQDQAS